MKEPRHWKWYFQTVKDAKIFYESAADIARKYDYVTLEDLYDLSNDYPWGIPCDTLLERRGIQWDFESIDPHRLSNYVSISPACSDGYCVTFYEIEPPVTEDTPEPINVTINVPNLTRGIIVDLMQQANEIKDRAVFITINGTD